VHTFEELVPPCNDFRLLGWFWLSSHIDAPILLLQCCVLWFEKETIIAVVFHLTRGVVGTGFGVEICRDTRVHISAPEHV
jgi:hypothetical protein